MRTPRRTRYMKVLPIQARDFHDTTFNLVACRGLDSNVAMLFACVERDVKQKSTSAAGGEAVMP